MCIPTIQNQRQSRGRATCVRYLETKYHGAALDLIGGATDRMIFLKNWEVKKQFQSKQREQGGYLVNSDCRQRRACSICADGKRISPQKLTTAEYEFARPKTAKRLDRSVARQNYIICPYAECPYKELMKYETYREYEEHMKIEIPDIYHLMGSDEDKRHARRMEDT